MNIDDAHKIYQDALKKFKEFDALLDEKENNYYYALKASKTGKQEKIEWEQALDEYDEIVQKFNEAREYIATYSSQ